MKNALFFSLLIIGMFVLEVKAIDMYEIECDTITFNTIYCTSVTYFNIGTIQMSTACLVDIMYSINISSSTILENAKPKEDIDLRRFELDKEELKVKKYGNIVLMLGFIMKLLNFI